jgi:hypothetical protein
LARGPQAQIAVNQVKEVIARLNIAVSPGV